MATSGTYIWTQTRAQAIAGALRKLGVLASGGTPTANQTSDANDALNAIVKAFHADGMPLWAIMSKTFTVTSGTASYTLGVGQTVDTPPPLKIIQALRTVSGASSTPMNIIDRYDYENLPDTATGLPVYLYYQPLISTGTVKLWPIPNDSTTTIEVHYQRPFQDMAATGDNFDFPPYWMQAIIYYLAWALAPEYGTPTLDRGQLQKEAMYWKEQALSYGTEEGSLFIQPEDRRK